MTAQVRARVLAATRRAPAADFQAWLETIRSFAGWRGSRR